MSADVMATSLSISEVTDMVSGLLPGIQVQDQNAAAQLFARLGKKMGFEGGAYLIDGGSLGVFRVYVGGRSAKTGRLTGEAFTVTVAIEESESGNRVTIKTTSAATSDDAITALKPHEEIREGIVAGIHRLDPASRLLQNRHETHT